MDVKEEVESFIKKKEKKPDQIIILKNGDTTIKCSKTTCWLNFMLTSFFSITILFVGCLFIGVSLGDSTDKGLLIAGFWLSFAGLFSFIAVIILSFTHIF